MDLSLIIADGIANSSGSFYLDFGGVCRGSCLRKFGKMAGHNFGGLAVGHFAKSIAVSYIAYPPAVFY